MSSYLSTTESATNDLLTCLHPKTKNILDWFGLPKDGLYSSMCLNVSSNAQTLGVGIQHKDDQEWSYRYVSYKLQHHGRDLDAAGVLHLIEKFGATAVSSGATAFDLAIEVGEIAAISVYTGDENHGWQRLYVVGPWDEKGPFTLKAV